MALASTLQAFLNKLAPTAFRTKLGDLLAEMITKFNDLKARQSSRMLTSAGLAIKTGGSAIVKAGNAFAAIANGTVVRKAANTDMAALVGTLATAKSALWAFYIDSAGTLTASAKTADAATHDAAIALLPAAPTGKAMIGFIVVDNATGSNFVGGTTALDAASLTVTYYNTTGAQPFVPADIGDLASRQ